MKDNILLPISILVAAVVIAGAIFYTQTAPQVNVADDGDSQGTPVAGAPQEVEIRPVDNDDHILGNADAPIVLVEFSDFECPFCGRFHETMARVMEDYGINGQVAWVYRHFPLDQIHPNARRAAEASECAASLGGNEAFWSFSNSIFESRSFLNDDSYTQIATGLGISESDFTQCLASQAPKDAVAEDFDDALKIARANGGSLGTPYSIVISKSGRQVEISGAQPYERIKEVIDALLQEIDLS